MAKPKTKIYELLRLIREHGPVSPNRLTELSGDARQSIDIYIRQAHKAGLIHVDSYGPNPTGSNKEVKLWVFGKGDDAQRVYYAEKQHALYIEKLRERRRQQVSVERQPLDEALFGRAA